MPPNFGFLGLSFQEQEEKRIQKCTKYHPKLFTKNKNLTLWLFLKTWEACKRHSIFPDIKAKIGHTYIASNTLHHFVSKEWPNLVAINLLTANPTNCLRVFDHFVGLELKRLRQNWTKRLFLTTTIHFLRLQPEFLKVLDFAETKFCINTKFSIYLVFVSLTSYSNINTSKSQVLNKKSITIRYNWPENHVNLVPLRFVWDHFWRLFLELEIESL